MFAPIITSPSQPERTFALLRRAPTIDEYADLCRSVGWADAINLNSAPVSLQHSLYCVLAVQDEQVVGMGRIVGDGAIYFYIQDVIVRPAFQGRGFGRCIVDNLMSWIRNNAPPRAFVGLFAAEGRDTFYAHYGFMRHPALTGMFYVVPDDLDSD
jgi:ribosomal protein S18 acetylase RimI-like enzyme